MSELKTKKNDASVEDFLKSVLDERKREDCFVLEKMMREITGEVPYMWGDSIVGFGDFHYKYKSGRVGDWFKVGFSPRKQALTIYIMNGFDEYEALMMALGKYRTSVSCLYVKKLEDINIDVLGELIKLSYNDIG